MERAQKRMEWVLVETGWSELVYWRSLRDMDTYRLLFLLSILAIVFALVVSGMVCIGGLRRKTFGLADLASYWFALVFIGTVMGFRFLIGSIGYHQTLGELGELQPGLLSDDMAEFLKTHIPAVVAILVISLLAFAHAFIASRATRKSN